MSLVPYPPSQTELYLHCPKEWDLSRRWEPLGEWTPNALMGTALGAALDVHRVQSQNISPYDVLPKVLETGWQQNEKWTLDGAIGLCTRVLKRAMMTDLLYGGKVWNVQFPLGPQVDKFKHGHEGMDPAISHHSVADLIVELPTVPVSYMIWDDKFNLECESQWIAKRLEETQTMVQLWEYALLGRRYHDLNVTHIGKHLMVGKPGVKSEVYTVEVTPARMALFNIDSTQWWEDMTRMDEQGMYPRKWGDACLKPWRCHFFDACHHLDGDETLMPSLYRKREK